MNQAFMEKKITIGIHETGNLNTGVWNKSSDLESGYQAVLCKAAGFVYESVWIKHFWGKKIMLGIHKAGESNDTSQTESTKQVIWTLEVCN